MFSLINPRALAAALCGLLISCAPAPIVPPSSPAPVASPTAPSPRIPGAVPVLAGQTTVRVENGRLDVVRLYVDGRLVTRVQSGRSACLVIAEPGARVDLAAESVDGRAETSVQAPAAGAAWRWTLNPGGSAALALDAAGCSSAIPAR